MRGTRVALRIRMGAHDAHYAGALVDGARLLALFGDLATELLVRHDGDEGLFRAYESVEFLAPVFAGDFVEAEATLLSVGETSRRIQFEARKVIASCVPADGEARAGAFAASAAEVLAEPRVVARAVGTCVVPKARQRRPQTAPDGVILTAAIVGAEVTREETPHLPFTALEVADEAARCREAGASVIHLHVRDDEGHNTQSAERYRDVIDAIRRKCDCVIQTSTGGAVGMPLEERLGSLACGPEMATLNCGTLNFGDGVFVNSRPDIRRVAARIRDAGAMPELECYEVGHVEEALSLAAEGFIAGPLHFQFVLGVKGALPAREDVLVYLRSVLPSGATFGVAAVSRFQRPMTELAMRLGGHARVGLEDNIYLEKGVLSEGSAPLVARAAAYARSIGREPLDPPKARKLLGLAVR